MSPVPGDVYLVDLGMIAKERPMLVVSRYDTEAPRALSLCVPFTTKNRGSRYEIPVGRLPFLRDNSWANVQGLVAVGNEKLQRRLGKLSPAGVADAKKALRYALDL